MIPIRERDPFKHSFLRGSLGLFHFNLLTDEKALEEPQKNVPICLFRMKTKQRSSFFSPGKIRNLHVAIHTPNDLTTFKNTSVV